MGCRRCGHCGLLSVGEDLFDGHDACIANLPGVKYACCGHAGQEVPYVAFYDGLSIYGNAALAVMEMLGGNPPPPDPDRRHPQWEWVINSILPPGFVVYRKEGMSGTRMDVECPPGWTPQIEIELDSATTAQANMVADKIEELLEVFGFKNCQVDVNFYEILDPGASPRNTLAS